MDASRNAKATVEVDPVEDITFGVEADDRATTTMLVRPSAELPAGPLTLSWRTGCSIVSPITPPPGEGTIQVIDAAPLPTTLGSAVQASAEGLFRVDLSAELLAYRSVMSVRVAIGGRSGEPQAVFVGGSYGVLGERVTSLEVGYVQKGLTTPADTATYSALRPRMDAFSSNTCAGKTGVVSIPIEVTAHVAGASADPSPITGAVTVDCDAAKKEYEDATAPPSSLSGGTQAGGASSSTGSGCQAAPAANGSALSSLALAFGAALAFVRRRRR